jgi:hypothetical protein
MHVVSFLYYGSNWNEFHDTYSSAFSSNLACLGIVANLFLWERTFTALAGYHFLYNQCSVAAALESYLP